VSATLETLTDHSVTYAENSQAVHDPFAANLEELSKEAVELLRRFPLERWTASLDVHWDIAIIRHLLEQVGSAASFHWLTPPPAESSNASRTVQRAKNEAAIRLLQKWISDESGYDEAVWPRVKEAIEENRLSERKRFSD
jgi:hypothetical protein